jgi:hypothetical protein
VAGAGRLPSVVVTALVLSMVSLSTAVGAGADGQHSVEICYGQWREKLARCYKNHITVGGGTISGESPAQVPGTTMTVNGQYRSVREC